MSEEARDSFSTSRRWGGWMNLVLCLAAVLALAGMANYLAHRHYQRIHWGERLDDSLTERTLEVLEEIREPVRVVVFFKQDDPLFRPVIELLRQYHEANPLVELETVDYEREPARAIDIQSEFELPKGAHSLVLFKSAGRVQEVTHDSIVGLNRAQFRGEQLFSSALIALASTNAPPVYFLRDNGTHDLEDRTNPDGYGLFKRTLREMNVELRALSFTGEQGVPTDCRLLILAGPKTELSEVEVVHLRNYLERGGRMWMMFRRESRGGLFLSSLLSDCGVEIENRLVDDPPHRFGDSSYRVNVEEAAVGSVHPALRKLATQGMSFRLFSPWTLQSHETQAFIGNEPRISHLFASSEEGRRVNPGDATRPDAPGQAGGRLPLGLVVEDVNPVDFNNRAMRLVVLGDSAWASNGMIREAANAELAWHLANWLMDRPHLLAIGPRPMRSHQYSITQQERRDLTAWLLGIVPGGIIGLGLLIWARRRN